MACVNKSCKLCIMSHNYLPNKHTSSSKTSRLSPPFLLHIMYISDITQLKSLIKTFIWYYMMLSTIYSKYMTNPTMSHAMPLKPNS